MKLQIMALALSIPVALWSYMGYWKYVHEPIDQAGFSRGVSVGVALQRCGVEPTPALMSKLVHFVDGDFAMHDCSMLRSEANRY